MQAGANLVYQAYAEAGVRAGWDAGLVAGFDIGVEIGAEYQRRWPKGGGPKVADLLHAKTEGKRAA